MTEIPYQANKAAIIEKIADLVQDGKLEGISDIRDESDREGMRIVIELKQDALPEGRPQPALQAHAAADDLRRSSCSRSIKMRPVVMNLKELMERFLEHREDVIIAAHAVRPRRGRGAGPHPRGVQDRARQHRRDRPLIKKSASPDEARAGAHEDVQALARSRRRRSSTCGSSASPASSARRSRTSTSSSSSRSSTTARSSRAARALLGIIRDELDDLNERFGDERRTDIVDQRGASSRSRT